jgi:hypothetical protein
MAAAGYSGTPLTKKLGIGPLLKLRLIHPPDNYFQLLETDVSKQVCPARDVPDWVHVFADTAKQFEKSMNALKPLWAENTRIVIWVSWYKKSAGIPTDLTENIIRDYALRNGLVDIKVCAVSELWSGLKLVVPVKLR